MFIKPEYNTRIFAAGNRPVTLGLHENDSNGGYMRFLPTGVLVAVTAVVISGCTTQTVQTDAAESVTIINPGKVAENTESAGNSPVTGDDTQRFTVTENTEATPSYKTYQPPTVSYQSNPTPLGRGGDKTYRGAGKFSQLPDSVASGLRLRGLSEQNLGAYVRAANGGQPLLTAYADTPRNPASTMKLVTTYAALGVLGPTYRWPTELYTVGQQTGDTLQGDIVIKGYGNPDFREGDFRQLLQALRARGIRNIAGNFIIDKSYFDVGYQPPIDENTSAAYNAQPEALLYNERGSCYEIRNKAGQVQQICPILPRAVVDLNANLFGDFWRMWVGEMGGHLNGGLQVRPTPPGAQLVHTHQSVPLRDIIVEINKDSNNVMARQLLLSLGAKQLGAPGTTQKGAAAVGQWLESRGLRFSNLRIENGSGLSRVERISAREMGEMLVDIYNSPYRDEMLNSLAVLGVDGTVKNRLKTLTGRGKFKTGTLRDVRALAGYLTAANGQTYVVALLHNDANIRASAKEAHDELVEWVYYGSRNNFASTQ